MTQNPYQSLDDSSQQSPCETTRCDQNVKRDRAFVAVIVSFSLLGLSVFLFRETIDRRWGSMEPAYTLVAYGFIASVVGVLFAFRPESKASTLPTNNGIRSGNADPIEQERSALQRKVNFYVSCFLVAISIASFGLAFWILAPRSAEVGSLYVCWFSVSAFIGLIGTLLIRGRSVERFRRVAIIANASVASVVMARVIWDCLAGSASHNLWPFEVGFACFSVKVGTCFGAATGIVVILLRTESHAPTETEVQNSDRKG